MSSTKLSSKYQIVVPKAVRELMRLRAGMTVRLYPLDNARAILVRKPDDYVASMKGLGKDVWQALGGADKYIKQERASWNKQSA